MSRPSAWAWAGGLASIALALALFDPYLFTGGDNAAYYALAKALATGRGYVDLVEPGAPPETLFPPGYPGLLVPFYWLGGGRFVVLKLVSVVAAAAALWATWRIARRDPAVPGWAAAAAVAIVGLSPLFLGYTHWVLSDMAFTAVGLLAVAAYTAAAGDRDLVRGDGWRAGSWVGATLVAVAAFYVRTAGIALLGAAVGWALWRRRWRDAALTAGLAVALAGPWLAWTATRPPATGGYLEQAVAVERLDPESETISGGGLAARMAENLERYGWRVLPLLFSPTDPAPLSAQVASLLLGGGLIGLGVARSLHRRGLTVGDLYVTGTIAIVLVWPWTGDRFLLPIAPLLVVYAVTGLAEAGRLIAGADRWGIPVAVAVAGLLLVGAARRVPDQLALTRAYLDGEEFAGYAPFWEDYFRVARWIGATAPDAVIAARKPTFAWYWSGRPSLVYPFHGDPDLTWRFFRARGVTHIILDGMTRDFLAPTLTPRIEELEVVHAGPHRQVYVVRIDPAPAETRR